MNSRLLRSYEFFTNFLFPVVAYRIMNTLKIICFLAVLLFAACQSNPEGSSGQDSVTTEAPSDTVFHGIDGAHNHGVFIKECYLDVDGRDSLKMSIEIDEQFDVKGQLEFANYQMDSSKGEVLGEIVGDTLIVIHEFEAEGTHNRVQRVFLRRNNQYFLGTGETEEVDGVHIFLDRSKINFDNTRVLDRIECEIT